MRTFINFFIGLYYSLPVQLLLSQLKNHKIILLFWALMFLAAFELFLKGYGSAFVLLDPEYQHVVGPTSLFLTGLSLGIFTLAYQMTSYILDGYQFYFIALERRPFLKFSFNNSLLPLAFWVTYLVKFYQFQVVNPYMSHEMLWKSMAAVVAGGALMTTLSILYFSMADADIVKFLGERLARELMRNPKVIIRKARKVLEQEIRVDYFLDGPFRIKAVDPNKQADLRTIVRVLNQNHRNALYVVVALIALIISLGVFQDNEALILPSVCTIMLFFSLLIMFVGAGSFWFRRMGMLTWIAAGALYLTLDHYAIFNTKDHAFGLDYSQPPAEYSYKVMQQLTSEANYQNDYAHGIGMLNNWLQRYYQQYGYARAPKLVLVCVTGGGNRSATWVVRCLQYGDSLTQGKLMDCTRLISGASGGMIGAAYYREELLDNLGKPRSNLYRPQLVDNVSRDVFNPIAFNLLANMFMPAQQFKDEKFYYEKERGYAFECQLKRNTGKFNRRLRDYTLPEYKAQVPLMVFYPAILNDARKLLICSQPVSYLCKPMRFNNSYTNEFANVEYSRLLAKHQPGALRLASIVRMNATFPTVLPNVQLPTSPELQVIDAGAIDNFGTDLAIRYLYVFRNWIAQHTSGVVLLQIRDSQRESEINVITSQSTVSKSMEAAGGAFNSFTEGKDFTNDDMLEYAKTWFPGSLDVVELQYIPANKFKAATLNFHVAQREKDDILRSVYRTANQESFGTLKNLLR